MKVRADQRSRDIYPAPEAERAAREAFREIADAEVKAAKALATIERSRAHVRHGFASVQSWAWSIGFGPQQANRLLALGRSLAAAPELDDSVRGGQVTAEAATSVGRVLLEPQMKLGTAERADWIRRASTLSPQALRAQAENAVEEARCGESTLPMRIVVTRSTREGFHRARLLMSRGKPRWITEGQTLARLVGDWLARSDPRKAALPRRLSGDTLGRSGRYVPRRVAAVVERRSAGTCEVCRVRRATAKIHIRVAHAEGGSREVDNIADACSDCHVLVDAGVFGFSHFDHAGRPQWDFHPESLYGPVGQQRPSRVREPRPPAYVARNSSRRTPSAPARASPEKDGFSPRVSGRVQRRPSVGSATG